jgi:L-glutamine-phosphate cytidylyltransferase
MKGIILAAGRGSRMGSLTSNLPKCRTVLHGKELIHWQLDALRKACVEDIAIIRGYLSETFEFDLTYFENKRWSETNMVGSLLSASSWLESDTCITSYSDIVYSSDAVNRLINSSGDIVITYDPNWQALWSKRFLDPLSDAETFKLDGNRVIEIGQKSSSIDEIEGQYMGLVKYTPAGWNAVLSYLKQLSQSDIDKLDMTKLFQNLIENKIVINAVSIKDKWFEVDSESDLNVYNGETPIQDLF